MQNGAASRGSHRVGIDIGGTFTDLAAVDEATGTLHLAKADTVSAAPERGVLDALAGSDVSPGSVGVLVHGTTIVINAVTERSGARTALLTTSGFRDVLEIGRANRPDLYNLAYRKPPPFVPRRLRFEVAERTDHVGRELTPLDEEALPAIAGELVAAGVEALAICFLHAWVDAAHERRAAEVLASLLPGVEIVCSSEVSREWREFERSSTVVLSAYVKPIVRRYLGGLRDALDEAGVDASLLVMRSSGGVTSFDRAATSNTSMPSAFRLQLRCPMLVAARSNDVTPPDDRITKSDASTPASSSASRRPLRYRRTMGFTYADRTTVEERRTPATPAHLARAHDLDAGEQGREHLGRAALVGRIHPGVEEADRERLDAVCDELSGDRRERLLVERGQLASHMVRPLRHLEAKSPRDERRWLAVRQVIEIGRFARPISRTSRNPDVVSSAVRAPLRSVTALITIVVPCTRTPTDPGETSDPARTASTPRREPRTRCRPRQVSVPVASSTAARSVKVPPMSMPTRCDPRLAAPFGMGGSEARAAHPCACFGFARPIQQLGLACGRLVCSRSGSC